MKTAVAPTVLNRSFTPGGRTPDGVLMMKANVSAREVEGYAATWDPDEVGDRILPNAFDQTLKERHFDPMHQAGRSGIRVLWQHDAPIGVLTSARVDDYGLLIKARISHTTQGNDALQLLADGAVDRMSIGYMVRDYVQSPGGVRILKDLDLWEVSFVTFPANTAAIVTGVKRMDGNGPTIEFRAQTFAIKLAPVATARKDDPVAVTLETKSGKVLAGRNVEKVKAIAVMCQKTMMHCKDMLHEAGHAVPDIGNGNDNMDAMEGPGGLTGSAYSQMGSNLRSEDAGGRGEPPSNHDVDRDNRKAASMGCPHCGKEFTIQGSVASRGAVEPEPDSIAGSVGPRGVVKPEPDSIASTANGATVSEQTHADSMDFDAFPEASADSEMDKVDVSPSGSSWEDFVAVIPPTKPSRFAPALAASRQEPNTCSSKDANQLVEALKSMRNRLVEI